MNSFRDQNYKNENTEKKPLVRLVNKLYSRDCRKYRQNCETFENNYK